MNNNCSRDSEMRTNSGQLTHCGFRSGSTRILKRYIGNKFGIGGTTSRQELLNAFTSPQKGILVLRSKYLREIIQNHRNLGVLNLFIPHTEEYTLDKEDFLKIAIYAIPDIYYTTIHDSAILPETIVLLREPSYTELASYSMNYFRTYFWSLLFHAEIHKMGIKWERQKRLSDMDISLFIEGLGLDVWEEIRTVLDRNNLLFDPQSDREVVHEFIAYYLQFYNFAPQCLSRFFPLLGNTLDVHSQILQWGIDEVELLEKSRPQGCAPTQDLIFYRDTQLVEPDHDLDIFNPSYYLDHIYNSPYLAKLESNRDQFKARYGDFLIGQLLSSVMKNSRIIGELSFKELIEKACREGMNWNDEQLLIFDQIVADGFTVLYHKASWLDRIMVYWRGTHCLQNLHFKAAKEKIAGRSLSRLQNIKTDVEQRTGKHWLYWAAFPIIALFKLVAILLAVLLWVPKSMLYGVIGQVEPYFLCAQKLMDRKRKRDFANAIAQAIVCGRKGNIAGVVVKHKTAIHLAKKNYDRLDSQEAQAFCKILDTELQHKLSYIEEKFSQEHSLTSQARESLHELLEFFKDTDQLSNYQIRLLQDIQKSYIDPHKEYFHVYFFKWLLSFGKYPLKVHLQAIPLKKKLAALKIIEKRLYKLKVREKELKRFHAMIEQALHHVERELREKFGKWIADAMRTADIVPEKLPVNFPKDSTKVESAGFLANLYSLPNALENIAITVESQQERIAFEKIREELVDMIVEKGHMQFTDVRDVISRNNLKLKDLTNIREFVSGDQLLKFDRSLGKSLVGIHRPAEVYMRIIHRFNALLFGTGSGRWLGKYILLPFGGALLIFELICYLLHLFHISEMIFLQPFQPFFHWILPRGIAVICKVEPSIAVAFGGALGGELVLCNTMFLLFKILWSLCVGLAILFFFYTNAGIWLGKKILRSLWKCGKFLFVDCPRGIWYFSPVQFLYKLRFWTLVNIFIIRPAIYSLPITIPVLYFTKIENYISPLWFLVVATIVTNAIVNTPIGRWIFDYLEEMVVAIILRINSTLFVNLYNLTMETFKVIMKWLEQLLYLVDDFFRFRKGEKISAHLLKIVFGKIWYMINYVMRFTINLIVEPQVNPIKHFPIVTISHKMVVPVSLILMASSRGMLEPLVGKGFALDLSMGLVFFFIQFGIPGICGFMAWELKENRKLYRHSLARYIRPIMVGSHGENIARLLKPGFHSGTIPKFFQKLRGSMEEFYKTGNRTRLRKLELQQHHLCQSLTKFSQRCFLSEFQKNPRIAQYIQEMHVEEASIYPRKICFPITMHIKDMGKISLTINYELKSDLICAYLTFLESIPNLPPKVEQYLKYILTVFWKKSGVEIVEEQTRHYLQTELNLDPQQYCVFYKRDGHMLQISLRPKYSLEIVVNLEYNMRYQQIRPKITSFLQSQKLEPRYVERDRMLFLFANISWNDYNDIMAKYLLYEYPIPENFVLPTF